MLFRSTDSKASIIHPLLMHAVNVRGDAFSAHAINEVSLLRQTSQIAKLRILVNGQERMAELVTDGVLVSTPAGSTAYNLSANGPILPLDTRLMALTPISAFRPRRWRGALLPDAAKVRIEVLEAPKRPVSVVADHDEFRDLAFVDIEMDHAANLVLLHDPGHGVDRELGLDERVPSPLGRGRQVHERELVELRRVLGHEGRRRRGDDLGEHLPHLVELRLRGGPPGIGAGAGAGAGAGFGFGGVLAGGRPDAHGV